MSLPSTSNQDTKALARIDFDSIDMALIEQVLSTGSLDALPDAERRYYDLMEMVRGLRARLKFNNKVVTKAGIIRLLKSEPYGLSDYMARRVYTDSMNFFWAQDDVRPRAWSNFYAERLENWANLLFVQGEAKTALRYMKLAAELRGCFDQEAPGVPEELLNQQQTVIYTTSRRDLGLPATDRRRVEQLIDAIPEVPELVRESVKEDANISQFTGGKFLAPLPDHSQPIIVTIHYAQVVITNAVGYRDPNSQQRYVRVVIALSNDEDVARRYRVTVNLFDKNGNSTSYSGSTTGQVPANGNSSVTISIYVATDWASFQGGFFTGTCAIDNSLEDIKFFRDSAWPRTQLAESAPL